MNLIEFTLPEFWASALINGDDSGMTFEDSEILNKFIKYHSFHYSAFSCVSVDIPDGGDFRKYHDANFVGVLACNVGHYLFDVGAPLSAESGKK